MGLKFRIEYSGGAKKQLAKLPNREARKVLRKISALESDQITGKFLQGDFAGFITLRAWPYRILYRVEGETIVIVSIAHRQGVYK